MDLPGTTMSSRVKDFMKNNEHIPEDIMEDIQRVLAKPRNELADLDAEIEELSGRLTQLRMKRNQIQKHISQYDHVLAPIRRLPVDILHEIFYHCLPTRRNPTMSAKEAPLLLTRVCRAWRQTAHASPPLWAQLYITFSDEDIVSAVQVPLAHGKDPENICDTLRLRCSAVEEWLSRSGACPLSISLCYTSRISEFDTHLSSGESEHTLTLFRSLARFATRWQRLELNMPVDAYRVLERMVPISQLSMLTSMRTSFVRPVVAISTASNHGSTINFWQAQNLKTMSLNISSVLPFTVILSNPNLSKLTSLSLNWRILVQDAASLLKNCPNLQYVMLTLIHYPHVPLPPIIQDAISLPHLRALCIVDSALAQSTQRLYDCIDAPKLEWLDYAYTKDIGFDYTDHANSNLTSIITLLQRLPVLKKLTISGNNLSTAELRNILRNAHSITHLVFGPETRTNDKSLGPSSVFMSTNYLWNFVDLFLQDGEREMGYEAGLPLVPRLEVLEISTVASTHLTDEVLRDIILHRANLIASKDVAPLKKVAALFSRARNIDISKELSTHSNTAKIELALRYLNNQWASTSFLSSGYGLNEFDRTWHYRDIEEEVRTFVFAARSVSLILWNRQMMSA